MPSMSFASRLLRTAAEAFPFGRRLAMAAALSLSLLGVAACGDDEGTGPGRGRYDLVAVDGNSLPVTFEVTDPQGNVGTITFNSGFIELESGNEYNSSLDVVVNGTAQELDDDGTYERDGDNVTFESSDGDDFEGEFDDEELTIEEELENGVSFTFTFERENDDDDDDDDN